MPEHLETIQVNLSPQSIKRGLQDIAAGQREAQAVFPALEVTDYRAKGLVDIQRRVHDE